MHLRLLRILVLLAWPFLLSARLLLDVQGNLELVPVRANSNFTLPEASYLWNGSNTFNLLQELRWLRETLTTQQAMLQDLQSRRSCDWEGVRCHCYFRSSGTLDDIVILLGTNCSAGMIEPTRVIDAVVAQTIIGCSFFNTTGRCVDVIQ